MSATMADITSVSPAPAGWSIRVVHLDEQGTVTAETLPVVALATLTAYAVNGSSVDRDVEAAILDPEDGSVCAFSELEAYGSRAARVIAPGERVAGYDETLLARLRDERSTRSLITGVVQ